MALKEKLYTIPVNDAFHLDCECPVCAMYQKLEQDAVEFTMGPSYMEDDIRMETDRLGFCSHHMRKLQEQNNKLGLALVLKTHIDRTNSEVAKKIKLPAAAGSLFKKASGDPVAEYMKELDSTCYICSRIRDTFARYLHTVIVMWKTDSAFRETYQNCKGFCSKHLGDLLTEAQSSLSKQEYSDFRSLTTRLYLENMQRMADDLEWFVNKFDYRYKDEPWKNSRDALIRAVVKTNGLLELEDDRRETQTITM